MLVKGTPYRTVWMDNGKVKMINQPILPHRFEVVSLGTCSEVAEAISNMTVRGAGAIGAAGAFGMALAAAHADDREDIRKAAESLKGTRPTAQNLFSGIDYVLEGIRNLKGMGEVREMALKRANEFADQDAESCRKIGEHGSMLIGESSAVLTHCNAGWLAFVDWGTALSPVYCAKRKGKRMFVFVDETRPRCQGARLTAWELINEGIPHAVIADNAAGHYMGTGKIDVAIVGADRIAANGDVANKIGTYEKAVVARENGIPFYVAAPTTTIDWKCPGGKQIPIEERDEGEVLRMFGRDGQGKMQSISIAPEGSKAKNPAFDVTPAEYISGIITEKGISKPHELGKLKTGH